MKESRRLSLDAERLTELTSGELREVNGGATIDSGCVDLWIHDPSDRFVSVCDGCLTNRDCRTLFC